MRLFRAHAFLLPSAAFLCCAALSLSAVSCRAQEIILDDAAPSTVKAPVSMDLSAIDKTADPCTDFAQYACGNWKKLNPMPEDKVRWGQFDELRDRNDYL